MIKKAYLSDDGRYRYSLTRTWDAHVAPACFICLNPSVADGEKDDPTVRRMMGFAKAWGCGGIVVGNLFAYIATNPYDIYDVADPVGPANDTALVSFTHLTPIIVAAWGAHGGYRHRNVQVQQLLGPRLAFHLGRTKGGHPKHPLYLPKTTRYQPFGKEAS